MSAGPALWSFYAALSDRVAGLGWGKFAVVCLLALLCAEALPDWALIYPFKALMPAAIFFCALVKYEAGARVKAQGAEAQARSGELQAKQQAQAWSARLNSHFLFNAMAALEYLIETDQPKALVVQRALSVYLRSGLGEPSMSSVSAQAKACEAYLEIQKARMAERIDYALSVSPDALSQPMPSRIAVAVLELAVHGGLEPRVDGGSVKIDCFRQGDGWVWALESPSHGFPAELVEEQGGFWRAACPSGTWESALSKEDPSKWRVAMGWNPGGAKE